MNDSSDSTQPSGDLPKDTAEGAASESGALEQGASQDTTADAPAAPAAGPGANSASTPPPPPLPPLPPINEGEGRGWCGWLVLAVAILVILWLVFRSAPVDRPAKLLPNNTILYVECMDLPKAGETIGKMAIWRDDESGRGAVGRKGVKQLYTGLLKMVETRTATDPDNPRDGIAPTYTMPILDSLKGFGFGLIQRQRPGFEPNWVLYLRPKAMAETVNLLRNEIIDVQGEPHGQFPEVIVLRSTNAEADAAIYLGTVGKVLVLSPELDLVKDAIDIGKGKREGLLNDPALLASPPPDNLFTVMVDPHSLAPHIDGEGWFEWVAAYFPAMELESILDRLDKDLRKVSSVRVAGPDEVIVESVIRRKQDAPAGGRGRPWGFWSYVGWGVLLILAILIGIPVLFLLVSALLAIYFYLVEWWNGDLPEATPPPPPPPSPQFQADTGVSAAPSVPASSCDKAGDGGCCGDTSQCGSGTSAPGEGDTPAEAEKKPDASGENTGGEAEDAGESKA